MKYIVMISVVLLLSCAIPVLAQKQGGLAAASGHGNLVMDGALRTFSFQAREFQDGEVQGRAVWYFIECFLERI